MSSYSLVRRGLVGKQTRVYVYFGPQLKLFLVGHMLVARLSETWRKIKLRLADILNLSERGSHLCVKLEWFKKTVLIRIRNIALFHLRA